MSVRRAALVAALTCVALAGCGGTGGEDGATVATAGPHAALVLLAPLREEPVRARTRGKHVEAELGVMGLASPGARVVVSGAGCATRCAAAVTADGSGNWAATLPVSLPAHAVTATVDATYAAPRSGDVPVRVTAPLDLASGARVGTPAASAPVTENEGPSGPGGSSASTFPAGLGGATHAITLIGDSLSVGQQPLLEAALPGWAISSSARIGRPLAEGMGILAAAGVPPGSILAMGLFTNDDPGHTSELEAAVRESLRRVGPSGCAIWATIAAPPQGGRTFDAANRLLNELATVEPRLRIVPWAEATSQQPSLLYGDGVHAVPAGAELRAALFAQAARSCG